MRIIVNRNEKLRRLEQENRRLQAQLVQAQADIAFVSVMTDVELPDMDGEEDSDHA
ncbi:MAG: hypothetical protein IKS21_02505 [Oscillospiraceae bacterium]|nr:hypothetical protein [Oscillospiraceae bacterium]